MREQPGMLGTKPPVQRGLEVLLLFPEAAFGEFRSLLGSVHACQQGLHDRAARGAHDIGRHTGQFDIGIFQYLLQTIDFRTVGMDQLAPVPRQVAKIPDLDRRDEAALEQPMLQEFRHPRAVLHVCLASRDLFDMRRIDE